MGRLGKQKLMVIIGTAIAGVGAVIFGTALQDNGFDRGVETTLTAIQACGPDGIKLEDTIKGKREVYTFKAIKDTAE